jgi:ribose-phosphate pyrophosphokinase
MVAVTHGLFTGGRWRELTDLGVSAIHTTDGVPGARARQSDLVHVHSIAPLLTEALERLAWQGAPRRRSSP